MCLLLARNSFAMRSYKKCVRNSIGMRTYKIIGLKVPQNEQLQKTGGGSPSFASSLSYFIPLTPYFRPQPSVLLLSSTTRNHLVPAFRNQGVRVRAQLRAGGRRDT